MTRRNTVLVVTNREDLHASAVIRLLNERGVRVFRLNTEDLLVGHALSLTQSSSVDDLLLVDHNSDRVLTGGEVAVVYFRRPASPVLDPEWPVGPARDVVAAESRWFLRWLWGWLSDRPWFTADPMTIDRAACKPLQLRVARTVGMRVPDTYYGNSPREISQFALGRRIVVKPIRETGYADDGVFHAFYTAEVDGAALESDVRALSETINFVQVMVPKREELRITWVDGRCLAARIHSQIGPEEAKLDWRKVHWQELDYSKAELPESLVDSISQYCHSLDLRFGAFDFVVTPEGHYVFLECNPNGQWLWLDERADMGIAAAIANALTAHTI